MCFVIQDPSIFCTSKDAAITTKLGTAINYERSDKPTASLSPFAKSINLLCLHGGKTGSI